jgi:two-component system nitrogen regulation response regulator NtrX
MNKNMTAKVLIIDDEAPIRDVLSASLRDEGYEVDVASNGEEGLQKLRTFSPQIVLLDIWMPGTMDGLDVLKASGDLNFNGNFIVMSGHGTIETAVKATKLGAWDFVEKPLSLDKINILLTNLLAYQTERQQKLSILNKFRQNFSLIGPSQATVRLKEQISKICSKSVPVLLRGEMGAGKQLVAQHIHYFSGRAFFPFIDINCAAGSSDLIEADLFGYKAGFFTGTTEDKVGKLEIGSEGTILLKEIESLDISVQNKIATFLKEQKFKPLGSNKEVTSNARLIIATSSNLKEDTDKGVLSPALYSILEANEVIIPSLRERREDVRDLVDHFSRLFEKEGAYRPKRFKDDAFSKLEEHSWPGNVRELKNFIERIFILIHSEDITSKEIQIAGITNSFDEADRMFDYNSTLREARSQFEKEFILKKLDENDGNISKTAELIGVERSHLHRKIKSYGIDA